MKNILEQSLQEQHIISIYTDTENTDRFSAGFIQALTETEILIAHVSPYGLYDGYLLKNPDDIYRLNYGGTYENTIEKLYSIRQQEHQKVSCADNKIKANLLQFALENHLVVSIELNNSGYDDIQGIVNAIDNNLVELTVLESTGAIDGYTTTYFNNITLLTCDSDKEIALKYLYENR